MNFDLIKLQAMVRAREAQTHDALGMVARLQSAIVTLQGDLAVAKAQAASAIERAKQMADALNEAKAEVPEATHAAVPDAAPYRDPYLNGINGSSPAQA